MALRRSRPGRDGWIGALALVFLAAAALLLLDPHPARALSVNVNIGLPAALSGAAQLDFEFDDNNTAVNSVTISNLLLAGGALGTALCDPTAACATDPPTYPATLSETGTLDNHLTQIVTLGTSISFRLDTTASFDSGGGAPDAFVFLILGSSAVPDFTVLPLVTTNGLADELFRVDFDGTPGGLLSIATSFAPSGVSVAVSPVQAAVPMSPSLILVVLGAGALLIGGSRRRARVIVTGGSITAG